MTRAGKKKLYFNKAAVQTSKCCALARTALALAATDRRPCQWRSALAP